jgi:hypothetical protein
MLIASPRKEEFWMNFLLEFMVKLDRIKVLFSGKIEKSEG